MPRPELIAPWEQDDPELVVDAAEDEKELQRLMDVLLDELRAVRPHQNPAKERCLAARRLHRDDDAAMEGRLRRRTTGPLDKRRLGGVSARLLPRKVSVDAETLDAVPTSARRPSSRSWHRRAAVSRASRSRFSSRSLDVLAEELRERRRRTARGGNSPSRCSRGCRPENVDPSQPGAIDAWMDDFNQRPREERDAIIGPAADRMAQAAGIRLPNGNRASRAEGPAAQSAEGGTKVQPARLTL